MTQPSKTDIAEWRKSAACRDTNPQLFFIEGSGPATARVNAAKAVCFRCPAWVAHECLKDLMSMTPLQRNIGQVRAGRYYPQRKSQS
jgi:transcription factor WhiB